MHVSVTLPNSTTKDMPTELKQKLQKIKLEINHEYHIDKVVSKKQV